jgi:hypothetical protein
MAGLQLPKYLGNVKTEEEHKDMQEDEKQD